MHATWLTVAGAWICASCAHGAPPAFTDVTVEAGLDVTFACAEGGGISLLLMCAGGAVADFNDDGWQDLFVVAGGSGPDRLYMNNGDGTFTDRAAQWSVAATHWGSGAAAGDYNGDGFVDLYVTSFGPVENAGIGHHKLYRNTGDGSFVEVAQEAGVSVSSPDEPDGFGSTFGDWDLDGDLDLVVCGWADTDDGTRLFRNNGDGTFMDVTAEATNLDEVHIFGFTPRLADMNGDRYPELLLAGDFQSSRYYFNNGDGTFTDATGTAGVSLESNGMGQTVGDVNNDGLLDWYVTSIYSDFTAGNFLYINQGSHVYVPSLRAGVDDGGWGWGTTAVDVNHDGWLDLVETNGWPQGIYHDEQSYLFMNDGGGETFTEMALAAGLEHFGFGRGLAPFDYDNDGDEDVVIFTYCGPIKLFRNDIEGASSLRLFLDTSAEPRLAPRGRGSIVRATVGDMTQMRSVDGGCNHLSHGELSAHFGLAGASIVDELVIEWANGRVTTLHDVPAADLMTIAYCPADFAGDGALNMLDFVAFGDAFAGGDMLADMDGDGTLTILDFVKFQMMFTEGCGG